LKNKLILKRKIPLPLFTQAITLFIFFTKQMTGEDFEIRFPAKAAGDPTFWNPTPEEISEMKAADLIFLNGASHENWLLCCLLG
jgi:ABC-type Zn uptake system ZnuABC Zn-binding protein ZnuA